MKKLAFILLAAPLIVGCSKKTVTVVHYKTAFAEISPYSAQVELVSEPSLDPASSSATVFYENVRVTLLEKTAKPGKLVLQDYLNIGNSGVRCSLEVSTPLGSCRGAVVLPPPVSIERPDNGDTLPWGDVWVAWLRSVDATWYEPAINYTAYDAGRNWLGYADTHYVVIDTNVVIPVTFLRKIPGTAYVRTSISVCPHTGPRPGAETGNLYGDIRGFLLGTGSSGYNYFYVGTLPFGAGSAPPPRTSEEKRRVFLRRVYGI